MRKIALISLMFLAATVVAMKPGPTIIRECPHCHAALKEYTIGSGNTLGARFWTDGKMLAPMLPEFPWLAKCPQCRALFWVDEAKKLSEGYSVGEKWKNAPCPEFPAEADFLNALSATNLTSEKTLFLRRRAWWFANDPARTNPAAAHFSPAQVKHLTALANLLEGKDGGLRIQRAEIFRELGKFDDCAALLQQPFKEDWQKKNAAFIKALAAKKISVVREYAPDESKAGPAPKKSGNKQNPPKK